MLNDWKQDRETHDKKALGSLISQQYPGLIELDLF